MLELSLALRKVSSELLLTDGRDTIIVSVARDLGTQELYQLYKLHNECRKSQPPTHTRSEPIPFNTWCATFMNLSTGIYLVAREGTTAIGVAFLERPIDGGGWKCGFLGIAPDRRGRGVAKKLKAVMISTAIDEGATVLTTNVLLVNEAMISINRHFGFKENGRRLMTYPDEH